MRRSVAAALSRRTLAAMSDKSGPGSAGRKIVRDPRKAKAKAEARSKAAAVIPDRPTAVQQQQQQPPP
eukprot:CAMPEP_0197452622 /NCGR_PEP_ID=MMETSP1175-20131217/32518_1 /TAXON_ID=1003142 /ORGANISM="Triceratium dubium, Strain CCMP147" /LENGTH=67 /DNA_ID=CAMNT_0042985681 /DNA_START=72 /DNA_END=271 /DNA_ORIENTATION=+